MHRLFFCSARWRRSGRPGKPRGRADLAQRSRAAAQLRGPSGRSRSGAGRPAAAATHPGEEQAWPGAGAWAAAFILEEPARRKYLSSRSAVGGTSQDHAGHE
eukprot:gene12285-biopygen12876